MAVGALMNQKWDNNFNQGYSEAQASAKDGSFAGKWMEALAKQEKREAFGYRKEATYENSYFSLANEMGVIEYKGTTFFCDKETNALKLGDCSNKNDCIIVSLEEGGTLVVNRDNISDLLDAITMFSPEDRRRILEAIQKDRMAQNALKELEETEASVLRLK